MKHIGEFEKFLSEEVNLNPARVTKLDSHVRSIASLLNGSDWGPAIIRYSPQGSWAHRTIIKPPGNRGFDADLLVFVHPVLGWTPRDYVLELRRVFRKSGTYNDKTSLGNRCVTIDYAGDFSVDIVPCVVEPSGDSYLYSVCNRTDDVLEPTDSEAFTAWLAQRNSWSGSDNLVEIIRLIKYLRDIKLTFNCKSVVITTLLGKCIVREDGFYQNTYFPDLPTALCNVIVRLDDYLQVNPVLPDVTNPVLPEESFTRHWDDERYGTFREAMHRYRDWIEDAFGEPDEARSRSKWQRVFGDEFGKGASGSVATAEETLLLAPASIQLGGGDIVTAIRSLGRQLLAAVPSVVPWMQPAPWRIAAKTPFVVRATAHRDRSGSQQIGPIESGQILRKALELRFEAVSGTGLPFLAKDFEVQWQVVNSDRDAWANNGLRGGFYHSQRRGVRWERTLYRGVHWVQAFVIRRRDNACIGNSERFFVVIE